MALVEDKGSDDSIGCGSCGFCSVIECGCFTNCELYREYTAMRDELPEKELMNKLKSMDTSECSYSSSILKEIENELRRKGRAYSNNMSKFMR